MHKNMISSKINWENCNTLECDVYKDEEGKPRYHWYKFSGMTTPIELLEKRDSHDTGRNSLRK